MVLSSTTPPSCAWACAASTEDAFHTSPPMTTATDCGKMRSEWFISAELASLRANSMTSMIIIRSSAIRDGSQATECSASSLSKRASSRVRAVTCAVQPVAEGDTECPGPTGLTSGCTETCSPMLTTILPAMLSNHARTGTDVAPTCRAFAVLPGSKASSTCGVLAPGRSGSAVMMSRVGLPTALCCENRTNPRGSTPTLA
mmetsp:Transcript_6992/g.20327  ORF Transcript_6992/g.20327 Transcript_6992/m.20327 type:complete len:201 (-) Transcript_6992:2475-3077(-)